MTPAHSDRISVRYSSALSLLDSPQALRGSRICGVMHSSGHSTRLYSSGTDQRQLPHARSSLYTASGFTQGCQRHKSRIKESSRVHLWPPHSACFRLTPERRSQSQSVGRNTIVDYRIVVSDRPWLRSWRCCMVLSTSGLASGGAVCIAQGKWRLLSMDSN